MAEKELKRKLSVESCSSVLGTDDDTAAIVNIDETKNTEDDTEEELSTYLINNNEQTGVDFLQELNQLAAEDENTLLVSYNNDTTTTIMSDISESDLTLEESLLASLGGSGNLMTYDNAGSKSFHGANISGPKNTLKDASTKKKNSSNRQLPTTTVGAASSSALRIGIGLGIEESNAVGREKLLEGFTMPLTASSSNTSAIDVECQNDDDNNTTKHAVASMNDVDDKEIFNIASSSSSNSHFLGLAFEHNSSDKTTKRLSLDSLVISISDNDDYNDDADNTSMINDTEEGKLQVNQHSLSDLSDILDSYHNRVCGSCDRLQCESSKTSAVAVAEATANSSNNDYNPITTPTSGTAEKEIDHQDLKQSLSNICVEKKLSLSRASSSKNYDCDIFSPSIPAIESRFQVMESLQRYFSSSQKNDAPTSTSATLSSPIGNKGIATAITNYNKKHHRKKIVRSIVHHPHSIPNTTAGIYDNRIGIDIRHMGSAIGRKVDIDDLSALSVSDMSSMTGIGGGLNNSENDAMLAKSASSKIASGGDECDGRTSNNKYYLSPIAKVKGDNENDGYNEYNIFDLDLDDSERKSDRNVDASFVDSRNAADDNDNDKFHHHRESSFLLGGTFEDAMIDDSASSNTTFSRTTIANDDTVTTVTTKEDNLFFLKGKIPATTSKIDKIITSLPKIDLNQISLKSLVKHQLYLIILSLAYARRSETCGGQRNEVHTTNVESIVDENVGPVITENRPYPADIWNIWVSLKQQQQQEGTGQQSPLLCNVVIDTIQQDVSEKKYIYAICVASRLDMVTVVLSSSSFPCCQRTENVNSSNEKDQFSYYEYTSQHVSTTISEVGIDNFWANIVDSENDRNKNDRNKNDNGSDKGGVGPLPRKKTAALIDEILVEIKRHNCRHIFFVGQGGGAALATLCGIWACRSPRQLEQHQPITVFSFGCPAAFLGDSRLESLHQELEQEGHLQHIRLVNQGDKLGQPPTSDLPICDNISWSISSLWNYWKKKHNRQQKRQYGDDIGSIVKLECKCESGKGPQEIDSYYRAILVWKIKEESLINFIQRVQRIKQQQQQQKQQQQQQQNTTTTITTYHGRVGLGSFFVILQILIYLPIFCLISSQSNHQNETTTTLKVFCARSVLYNRNNIYATRLTIDLNIKSHRRKKKNNRNLEEEGREEEGVSRRKRRHLFSNICCPKKGVKKNNQQQKPDKKNRRKFVWKYIFRRMKEVKENFELEKG